MTAVGVAQAAWAGEQAPDRATIRNLERPAVNEVAPITGLPHAGGRSFASLDAYLAYLRAYSAPIDKPWYREVRPGVFELQRGNLRRAEPPPVFTRAELERKFGFAR